LFVPTSFRKVSGKTFIEQSYLYIFVEHFASRTICIKNILHWRAYEWKDRVKRLNKQNLMLVWYQWVPNPKKTLIWLFKPVTKDEHQSILEHEVESLKKTTKENYLMYNAKVSKWLTQWFKATLQANHKIKQDPNQ
jgi:hypothetical protein